MSEATSIVLQPNVDVLLGSYSPLMSSVPGFPFRFNTEDDCEIEVSVDTGILCRWDIQNGIVTQCGKTTSCAKGEILYWSPLTGNKELAENAIITVTATDKGKTVGEQTISIKSDNFIYSACIDELKIICVSHSFSKCTTKRDSLILISDNFILLLIMPPFRSSNIH